MGFLGTRFTMEEPFYRERLEARGLTVLVPEAEDRETIHRIIYEELCRGEIRADSRSAYEDVMRRLVERGAEGIILGCTEISLLVGAENASVPLFDTTEIHARTAALRAVAPSPRGRNVCGGTTVDRCFTSSRGPLTPDEGALTLRKGNDMIRGMHAMFYSSEAEALRAFFRDKLGLRGSDVGGGWLIFDAPEADLGVHPTDEESAPSGTADISFYCDDIEETVRELRQRGVEFTDDIVDHGYGYVTHFKVPGDFKVQLYQPKYRK